MFWSVVAILVGALIQQMDVVTTFLPLVWLIVVVWLITRRYLRRYVKKRDKKGDWDVKDM
jgi:hypothetical protein